MAVGGRLLASAASIATRSPAAARRARRWRRSCASRPPSRQIEARRVGNDVYVTRRPCRRRTSTHRCRSTSARIDVYGYTGRRAAAPAACSSSATLVGHDLRSPAPSLTRRPDAAPPTRATPVAGRPGHRRRHADAGRARRKAIPPAAGTAKRDDRGRFRRPRRRRGRAGPLRRFYYRDAVQPARPPGPPGTVAELRLTELPDAAARRDGDLTSPTRCRSSGSRRAASIGFLLDRALPAGARRRSTIRRPTPASARPQSAAAAARPDALQRVSRDRAGSAGCRRSPAARGRGAPSPPAPINPAPLDALTLRRSAASSSASAATSCARCAATARRRVEGDAVAAARASPRSTTFRPRRRRGLGRACSEGAISLIWEPNAELTRRLPGLARRGGRCHTAPAHRHADRRGAVTATRRSKPGAGTSMPVLAVDTGCRGRT